MRYNYSKILLVLFTSFLIPFLAPYIFDPGRFGLFFGWEIGVILQTLIAFWGFSIHNFPPHISAGKHTRHILYILAPILLSLLIYALVKTKVIIKPENELSFKYFLFSLFRDSITIIPMLVFFIFNFIFYFQIKKELKVLYNGTYERYGKLLKRVMLTIDVPCLLPYITILIFSYLHSKEYKFQWETYISGAGSLLLMVSNFLTLSFHFTNDE